MWCAWVMRTMASKFTNSSVRSEVLHCRVRGTHCLFDCAPVWQRDSPVARRAALRDRAHEAQRVPHCVRRYPWWRTIRGDACEQHSGRAAKSTTLNEIIHDGMFEPVEWRRRERAGSMVAIVKSEDLEDASDQCLKRQLSVGSGQFTSRDSIERQHQSPHAILLEQRAHVLSIT